MHRATAWPLPSVEARHAAAAVTSGEAVVPTHREDRLWIPAVLDETCRPLRVFGWQRRQQTAAHRISIIERGFGTCSELPSLLDRFRSAHAGKRPDGIAVRRAKALDLCRVDMGPFRQARGAVRRNFRRGQTLHGIGRCGSTALVQTQRSRAA